MPSRKLFASRVEMAVVDEDGAVTVDWVVLTAAIVTVAIVGIGVISPGVYQTASKIESDVQSATNF